MDLFFIFGAIRPFFFFIHYDSSARATSHTKSYFVYIYARSGHLQLSVVLVLNIDGRVSFFFLTTLYKLHTQLRYYYHLCRNQQEKHVHNLNITWVVCQIISTLPNHQDTLNTTRYEASQSDVYTHVQPDAGCGDLCAGRSK